MLILTQVSRRLIKELELDNFLRILRDISPGFMKLYPNFLDGVSIMTLFDLI